ncbi:hypothetical protein D5S17_18615 [Pseudonocardiaceae bacterium YIM PH 21723]|nr:hypothetical protein D5S17_18615 [Pseudonocardiaceae bacterium YIM PH 21723]
MSALLLGAAPASAELVDVGFEAQAFAVRVVRPGGLGNVGPLAWSKSDTGPTENSVVDQNVPGVVTAKGITTFARKSGNGNLDAEAATSDVQIGVLGPLAAITVGSLKAECHSTPGSITGGSTIANPTIAGVPINITGEPNQQAIPPGVPGKVTFNEQYTNPDGSRTFQALHVVGPDGTDVVISSVTCGPADPNGPMASGAGMWIGFGLLAAIAVPVGLGWRRRRQIA